MFWLQPPYILCNLLCIITLTTPIFPTSHPHSHQHCCAQFYSINSCLPVCIQQVRISNCVTPHHSTYQSLVTLVLNSNLWTLYLHLTLCSSPLGSLNHRLNSQYQTPSYHKFVWTSDFGSQPHTKYLDLDSREGQCESWCQCLNSSELSPKYSVVQWHNC